MPDQTPNGDNYQIVRQVTSQTLGAMAGLYAAARGANPMLAAAVSNSAGDVAEGIMLMATSYMKAMYGRLHLAWESLEYYSGLTNEQLLARTLRDQVSLDMSIRVLNAAAESPDENWIRSLCSALVNGLAATDSPERDDYKRAIDTLATMDPADATILAKMCTTDKGWEKRRNYDTNFCVAAEEFPVFENSIDAIFARLSSLGLIHNDVGGGGINYNGTTPWLVSPFGRFCNTAARIIGEDEDSTGISNV